MTHVCINILSLYLSVVACSGGSVHHHHHRCGLSRVCGGIVLLLLCVLHCLRQQEEDVCAGCVYRGVGCVRRDVLGCWVCVSGCTWGVLGCGAWTNNYAYIYMLECYSSIAKTVVVVPTDELVVCLQYYRES